MLTGRLLGAGARGGDRDGSTAFPHALVLRRDQRRYLSAQRFEIAVLRLNLLLNTRAARRDLSELGDLGGLPRAQVGAQFDRLDPLALERCEQRRILLPISENT